MTNEQMADCNLIAVVSEALPCMPVTQSAPRATVPQCAIRISIIPLEDTSREWNALRSAGIPAICLHKARQLIVTVKPIYSRVPSTSCSFTEKLMKSKMLLNSLKSYGFVLKETN
jgi:hypothetical protein